MAVVTSEDVAAYLPLVERLARKRVGWAGAEFDDLVQEGLIFVWQTLQKGIRPAPDIIENRQQNWVRYLRRQNHLNAMPYGLVLPLDNYGEIPLR